MRQHSRRIRVLLSVWQIRNELRKGHRHLRTVVHRRIIRRLSTSAKDRATQVSPSARNFQQNPVEGFLGKIVLTFVWLQLEDEDGDPDQTSWGQRWSADLLRSIGRWTGRFHLAGHQRQEDRIPLRFRFRLVNFFTSSGYRFPLLRPSDVDSRYLFTKISFLISFESIWLSVNGLATEIEG